MLIRIAPVCPGRFGLDVMGPRDSIGTVGGKIWSAVGGDWEQCSKHHQLESFGLA